MQTEFMLPLGDRHFDVEPPSRDGIDFDEAIDRMVFDFRKLALPHVDIAFEMPIALNSVRTFRPAFPMDVARRDTLVGAIANAAAAAARRLPPAYYGTVIVCMTAATIIVQHWAEDESERVLHHPHRIADARMHVRIFERYLHNISDLEYLQQRKSQRRHDTVDVLIRETVSRRLCAEELSP